MKIINLVQGSPEWIAFRKDHFTASDAAVMLGYSKQNGTRDELLNLKKLGTEKEFSDWVQRHILDKGHEVEASARAIIESELGEELYPITAVHDENSLIAASLDGMDMMSEFLFEHKQWNEELVAYINEHQDLPSSHWPQLEQQLYVSEARHVKFVVSNGTTDKRVIFEYFSQPERIKEVLDGWNQFEIDLANHVPTEKQVATKGQTLEPLPTLLIEIQGGVKSTNLPAFKSQAIEFINSINETLVTDQDFANAEEAVKYCKKAEDDLKSKKQAAMDQTADIADLFATVDYISEALRQKRLSLDKLVKAEKENKKSAIFSEAKQKLAEHIDAINAQFKGINIGQIASDFAGAAKGKKTLASIQSSVNDELARAKITANNIGKTLALNSAFYEETAGNYRHLFSDLQHIILAEHDVLKSIVIARIAEFEKEEASRLEIEREQIRKEEQAKSQREAAAQENKTQEPETTEEKPEPKFEFGKAPAANEPLTSSDMYDINALVDIRHSLGMIRYPLCKNQAANTAVNTARQKTSEAVDAINAAISSIQNLQAAS